MDLVVALVTWATLKNHWLIDNKSYTQSEAQQHLMFCSIEQTNCFPLRFDDKALRGTVEGSIQSLIIVRNACISDKQQLHTYITNSCTLSNCANTIS